jgi:hypothetical protein
MVLGSPLRGKVAARVGPRPPIAVGLALMAVAVYLISTLSLDTDYADLWLPTAMMGFGVGFALTPMNLAAMNAVSRDHAGAASGLLVTLSGLGATIGVAVTGAIFNELNAVRTGSLVGERGVHVSRAQAQELDGLLAGTPGATRTLHQVAGPHAHEVKGGGGSLRLGPRHQPEAVGGAHSHRPRPLMVLMRCTSPADADPVPPIVAPPTPRPAPRRITAQ